MDPVKLFEEERKERIVRNGRNNELIKAAKQFNYVSNRDQYSYNFSWMGRPIIQYPQDMIAMQEIIYSIKPDVIIETGIAHGGSLVFYASLLELIGKGVVLGIDIDIRKHNRIELEKHSMFKRIKLFEGSSVEESMVAKIKEEIRPGDIVMVLLDSNHTHDHVYRELELYNSLVSIGSYLVVFDTIIEDLPAGMYDRPWDVGNNAKTAVKKFLELNNSFEIDTGIDNKLLISVAPQGYLKRVK